MASSAEFWRKWRHDPCRYLTCGKTWNPDLGSKTGVEWLRKAMVRDDTGGINSSWPSCVESYREAIGIFLVEEYEVWIALYRLS